jgi:hypothetical protein
MQKGSIWFMDFEDTDLCAICIDPHEDPIALDWLVPS